MPGKCQQPTEPDNEEKRVMMMHQTDQEHREQEEDCSTDVYNNNET